MPGSSSHAPTSASTEAGLEASWSMPIGSLHKDGQESGAWLWQLLQQLMSSHHLGGYVPVLGALGVWPGQSTWDTLGKRGCPGLALKPGHIFLIIPWCLLFCCPPWPLTPPHRPGSMFSVRPSVHPFTHRPSSRPLACQAQRSQTPALPASGLPARQGPTSTQRSVHVPMWE